MDHRVWSLGRDLGDRVLDGVEGREPVVLGSDAFGDPGESIPRQGHDQSRNLSRLQGFESRPDPPTALGAMMGGPVTTQGAEEVHDEVSPR
jgi:hypothetical protein